ncbi:MAG TPA: glycosyltransferase [Aggregatilineales bacterium]|nr:glycosyltransferase [Aggregatilineales bacterium]
MPTISVIIPTYNRAELLLTAVESVQHQTYRDFEIIVIDDGSVDYTPSLANSFEDNIRYKRILHSGRPAVARNAGLRLARGKYVAFLDSDDLWLPEKLERQVEILTNQPSTELVCSNAYDCTTSEPNSIRLYLGPDQGASGEVLFELLANNFVITSTVMASRDVLEKLGGFCEAPELTAVEDYDLWLRLASQVQLVYLPQPLARYRNDSEFSLRGTRSQREHWRAKLMMLRRVRDVAAQNGPLDRQVQASLDFQTDECFQLLMSATRREQRRLETAAIVGQYCVLSPGRFARWALRRIGRQVQLVGSQLAQRWRSADEKSGQPMGHPLRLHLGCGEVYLPGYINIDFPPAEHTVQQNTRADRYADLTQLNYEDGSVNEIRLHHVFEHFDRATALRLLLEWYEWLAANGCLTIETPDFNRSAWAFLFGSKSQQLKVLRHLFGSQEAGWAVHYDGWYRSKFEFVLTRLGYHDLRFRRSSWRGTYNIQVTARKRAPYIPLEERRQAAEELLRLSLVDDSESEKRLLQVWLEKL